MIKELPDVTMIAICGSKHGETIAAIHKSLKEIKPFKTILLTNIDIEVYGVEVINVGGLETWDAYNKFCVFKLNEFFNTSHCLLIQWDGYILDGGCWTDEFLEFDYLGAKWLDIGKPYNVGNGGFSMRSKKLQNALATDKNIITYCPEDTSIAKVYGQYLMDNHGIKFAPEEIADKFSFELNQPLHPTFGYHGFHWGRYKETVVIKRDHSLGDVIMCEPVLHYFHEQGYNVVIDTQEQFEKVFFQHYFQVWSMRYVNPKLKCRVIDLNMAYEISPDKPVLQSYYEMAGIKGVALRNSILSVSAGNNQKLFDKYVLIHIDKTGMEYRDSFGVNWSAVVNHLQEQGYKVFQIGRRLVGKEIAPYLNTMNLEFMMFIMKGADLFVGHDSGCAQVAVGFNIPSAIFFGSVDSRLRYNNFDRISVIQSACPSEKDKHCYHRQVDTVGKDCVYDKEMPPCTQYSATQVINAIKPLICNAQNGSL